MSVTEVIRGANGTVAPCRELPELLQIGDDHDDAMRPAEGDRAPRLPCQVTAVVYIRLLVKPPR